MIKYAICGDWCHEVLISPSVGRTIGVTFYCEAPVAVAILIAKPYPARTWFALQRSRATSFDSLKKANDGGRGEWHITSLMHEGAGVAIK